MTSTDILRALMSFELDAGITYIDNEPLEHVRTHAIGKEEYVLVTPADSPLAGRPTVTWTEVAALALCLLHRDMQNRRIIETIFESVGARPNPRIETNSMMSKYCYLRAGYWSTIMPRSFVEWLAPPAGLQVAQIVEPSVVTSRRSAWLSQTGRPFRRCCLVFGDTSSANRPWFAWRIPPQSGFKDTIHRGTMPSFAALIVPCANRY